eukprot:TRINITY_DN24398_c0_g1_i1.p1 TRINITY_DN24398_c0_g1~~TRINITY_DN24398_c0_g1_i1.p1  ORF type:complete len:117 (+),score=23.01 TRINITY_DN24398_c0_g1_i1:68-418(+)
MCIRDSKFANQGKIKYELEDNAGIQRILLIFKIRHPTLAREIVIEEFKELRITRIYPPFRRDAEDGLRRAVSLMPSENKAIQQDDFEEKVAPRSVFVAKVPTVSYTHLTLPTICSV